MTILNSTQRLLLKRNLEKNETPVLLSSHVKDPGAKRFTLYINSLKSAKNETIDGLDVGFSIEYFRNKYRNEFPGFANIKNVVFDEKKVIVELKKSDHQFLDVLLTPFFHILSNSNPFQNINGIEVPVETGDWIFEEVSKETIKIKKGKNSFGFSSNKKVANSTVTAENSSNLKSLNGLFLFFDPKIQDLAKRSNFVSKIYEKRNDLKKFGVLPQNSFTSNTLYPQNAPGFELKKTENNFKSLKILVVDSVPYAKEIVNWIEKTTNVSLKAEFINATEFYEKKENVDLVLLWMFPDCFHPYSMISAFQCDGGPCFFNWKDQDLEKKIKKLEEVYHLGGLGQVEIQEIDRDIYQKGYGVNLGDINFWIVTNEKKLLMNQLGIGFSRADDFF